MRRWNGWSDEGAAEEPLSGDAATLLRRIVGPGTPPRDATLDDVLPRIPEGRLPAHPLLSAEPEDRLRHARGQSLQDWIALRSGRVGRVPDAVARPSTTDEVRELLAFAAASGATLIPYGGGTSVVGGVTPGDDDRPVLTMALERLAGLRSLDARSGLATFGAGTLGPGLEAALADRGFTLGHSPQSFERSTVGGWVVTRSAGHRSVGFGRIESSFAGGRLESPRGTLELPTHPASAAGPDLRQLVLGSEGRLGLLTEVVVRALPTPDHERLATWFARDWPTGMELARAIGQTRLPVSAIRLSTPLETASLLAMAGKSSGRRLLDAYLRARGVAHGGCLLIVEASGRRRIVEAAIKETASLARAAGAVRAPGSIGRRWRDGRYRSVSLRDRLWAQGYALDTLETATDWSRLPDLAVALAQALRHGLDAAGERVHAFSHLSHVYGSGSSLYTTYVYRIAGDPDETLDRWRRLKRAASEAIVAGGGTISHQHGVGRDHLPYLAAEKGELGMALLRDVAARLDPDGVMNPGVLVAQ